MRRLSPQARLAGLAPLAPLAALALSLAGCPLGASRSTTIAAGGSIATSGDHGAPSGTGTPRLPVPDLIGKTPEEAHALALAAGFAHAPEATRPLECEGAPRDPGRINCQDPEPGAVAARYTLITINVFRPQVIAGAIVRSQLETLHGLTPDQARQQLKKLGHDGQVTIADVTDSGGGHTYLKDCGQNKVCYTSSESGIGVHDDLILFVNPTLKIAPPP